MNRRYKIRKSPRKRRLTRSNAGPLLALLGTIFGALAVIAAIVIFVVPFAISLFDKSYVSPFMPQPTPAPTAAPTLPTRSRASFPARMKPRSFFHRQITSGSATPTAITEKSFSRRASSRITMPQCLPSFFTSRKRAPLQALITHSSTTILCSRRSTTSGSYL